MKRNKKNIKKKLIIITINKKHSLYLFLERVYFLICSLTLSLFIFQVIKFKIMKDEINEKKNF